MTARNISAWTARSGSFPPYISLNAEGDKYMLYARAAPVIKRTPEYPEGYLTPGPAVAVELDPETLQTFLLEAMKNFRA